MSNTTRHKPYATIIAIVVVAAYYLGGFDERPGVAPTTTTSSGAATPVFDERVDGQMVDGEGVVDRLLPDDNEGSSYGGTGTTRPWSVYSPSFALVAPWRHACLIEF